MALTKNLQNLQPENNMSYKAKVMVKEMKMMNKINLKKSNQIKSLGLFNAYILVTGDVTVAGGDKNANVEFKKYAPFRQCVTHINDKHIDTA